MGCAASEEDDPILKKGKPAVAPIRLSVKDRLNESQMMSPANMDLRSSRQLSNKNRALDAALFDMAAINNEIAQDEDLDLALAERQISYNMLQETSRSMVGRTRVLGQSVNGEDIGEGTMTEPPVSERSSARELAGQATYESVQGPVEARVITLDEVALSDGNQEIEIKSLEVTPTGENQNIPTPQHTNVDTTCADFQTSAGDEETKGVMTPMQGNFFSAGKSNTNLKSGFKPANNAMKSFSSNTNGMVSLKSGAPARNQDSVIEVDEEAERLAALKAAELAEKARLLHMKQKMDMVARSKLIWEEDLSPEDQAKLLASRENLKNEASKARQLAEITQAFQDSNSQNSDFSLLNRVDSEVFIAKLEKIQEEEDSPHMSTSKMSYDLVESIWELYNGKTDGSDGVSLEDYLAVTAEIDEKTRAMQDKMAKFRVEQADQLEIIAKARREWMQGLNHWNEGVNPDDEDLDQETRNKKAAKTKAWRAVELTEAFQTFDTNHDGIFDKQEFTNFMDHLGGLPYLQYSDIPEETQEQTWALFNSLSEETDGVTLDDLILVVNELEAATQRHIKKLKEALDEAKNATISQTQSFGILKSSKPYQNNENGGFQMSGTTVSAEYDDNSQVQLHSSNPATELNGVDQEEISRLESERLAAEQEATRLQAEALAAKEEAAKNAADEEAAKITADEEAARLEAERLIAQQEAQRLEAERIAQEEAAKKLADDEEAARIEAERVAAEQEAARIEAKRLAMEAEQKRLADEQEAQRLADRDEANRLAEKQANDHIEAERLEAARLEQERLAAERDVARMDAERLAAKQKADQVEAERLAAEAEAKRLADDEEAARIEAERVAAEQEAARIEAQRLAMEAEAKRLADEQEAKRLADEQEAQMLADEEEAKRLADEQEEKRLAEEEEQKRLAAEQEALALQATSESKEDDEDLPLTQRNETKEIATERSQNTSESSEEHKVINNQMIQLEIDEDQDQQNFDKLMLQQTPHQNLDINLQNSARSQFTANTQQSEKTETIEEAVEQILESAYAAAILQKQLELNMPATSKQKQKILLPELDSDDALDNQPEQLANTERHYTTQIQSERSQLTTNTHKENQQIKQKMQESSSYVQSQSEIQCSQLASYRSHREKMHESAPITVNLLSDGSNNGDQQKNVNAGLDTDFPLVKSLTHKDITVRSASESSCSNQTPRDHQNKQITVESPRNEDINNLTPKTGFHTFVVQNEKQKVVFTVETPMRKSYLTLTVNQTDADENFIFASQTPAMKQMIELTAEPLEVEQENQFASLTPAQKQKIELQVDATENDKQDQLASLTPTQRSQIEISAETLENDKADQFANQTPSNKLKVVLKTDIEDTEQEIQFASLTPTHKSKLEFLAETLENDIELVQSQTPIQSSHVDVMQSLSQAIKQLIAESKENENQLTPKNLLQPPHKDINIDNCSDSSCSNISARDHLTKPEIVVEQLNSARSTLSQGNQDQLQTGSISAFKSSTPMQMQKQKVKLTSEANQEDQQDLFADKQTPKGDEKSKKLELTIDSHRSQKNELENETPAQSQQNSIKFDSPKKMFSSKTPAAKGRRRTLLSGSQDLTQEQQLIFASQTPKQQNQTKQKFENMTDSQRSQYTSEGMFYEASQTEQEVESLRSDSETSEEYQAMKQEQLIETSNSKVRMPADSHRSKKTDFTQDDYNKAAKDLLVSVYDAAVDEASDFNSSENNVLPAAQFNMVFEDRSDSEQSDIMLMGSVSSSRNHHLQQSARVVRSAQQTLITPSSVMAGKKSVFFKMAQTNEQQIQSEESSDSKEVSQQKQTIVGNLALKSHKESKKSKVQTQRAKNVDQQFVSQSICKTQFVSTQRSLKTTLTQETTEEKTKCDVIKLGNNEEYKDQLTDDELQRLRMVENFAKVAQAIHIWENSLSTEDQQKIIALREERKISETRKNRRSSTIEQRKQLSTVAYFQNLAGWQATDQSDCQLSRPQFSQILAKHAQIDAAAGYPHMPPNELSQDLKDAYWALFSGKSMKYPDSVSLNEFLVVERDLDDKVSLLHQSSERYEKNFKETVQTRYDWYQNLSADDQDFVCATKYEEHRMESSKIQRIAEIKAIFEVCDSNKDGLLDRSDFNEFVKQIEQRDEARNIPHMSYGAQDKNQSAWNLFNDKNPVSNKVSLDDFLSVEAQLEVEAVRLEKTRLAAEIAQRLKIQAEEKAKRERLEADEAQRIAREAASKYKRERFEAQEALRRAEEANAIAEKELLEYQEAERARRQAEEVARREREEAEEAERLRKEAAEEAERLQTAEAFEKLRIAEENERREREEAEAAERALKEAEAKAEKERLEAEEAERLRIEAEEKVLKERLEAEEAERIMNEAEEQAQKERLEAEEAEQIAREAAEQAEKEQLEAERKAKREQLAAEEALRLAREAEEAAKIEQEQILKWVAQAKHKWLQGLSPEVQSQIASYADKHSLARFQAERNAEIKYLFKEFESDLLNKNQFEAQMEKLDKRFAKKSVAHLSYAEMPDEMKQKVWDLYNGQSSGADGVSVEDFLEITNKLNTLTNGMQKRWIFKAAIVQARFAWMLNLSVQDQAKVVAYSAKNDSDQVIQEPVSEIKQRTQRVKMDPTNTLSPKQARIAEVASFFTASNISQSGVLNREEMEILMNKIHEGLEFNGVPHMDYQQIPEDHKDKAWYLYNSWTKDSLGVSLEDFLIVSREIDNEFIDLYAKQERCKHVMYDNMLQLSDDKLVWLQSLSLNERAKVYAYSEEIEKNDQAKAQRINSITELFQITANGSDSIDRDQFEELMAKFDQSAIEKGTPQMTYADMPQEMKDRTWTMFNCKTAGRNQISLADFLSVMNESDELFAPELKELKQRDKRYIKDLESVANARYAWTKSLSPEDQKIYFQMVEDAEERNNNEMEDFQKAFEAATQTGETPGLLTTKDQSQIFMVMCDQNAKAQGRPHMSYTEDMSDSVKDSLWELYSQKNPKTQDVSLADILAVKREILVKMNEIKNETVNKQKFMAETLYEVAQARFDWQMSLSAADKGILQACEELMEGDEAKTEALVNTTEAFRQASNNSTLLNRAQFEEFLSKLEMNYEEKEVPCLKSAGLSDEIKDKTWAIFNGESEDTDGVSLEDFFAVEKKLALQIQQLELQEREAERLRKETAEQARRDVENYLASITSADMFWEELEKEKGTEEDYVKPGKLLNGEKFLKTQHAKPVAEQPLIEMDYVEDEMTFIENSYMEGDTVDFYNEHRVYLADLSAKKKAALKVNKQSVETLMQQKASGKPVTQFSKAKQINNTAQNTEQKAVNSAFDAFLNSSKMFIETEENKKEGEEEKSNLGLSPTMGMKADAMFADLDVSEQDNLLLETQEDVSNLVTLNSQRTDEKMQIDTGIQNLIQISPLPTPVTTLKTERVDNLKEHYVQELDNDSGVIRVSDNSSRHSRGTPMKEEEKKEIESPAYLHQDSAVSLSQVTNKQGSLDDIEVAFLDVRKSMSILKPKADIESMQASARANNEADLNSEIFKPGEEAVKENESDDAIANLLSANSGNSKNSKQLMINVEELNGSEQNSSRNMIYFNGRSAAGSGKNANELDHEDGMFKGLKSNETMISPTFVNLKVLQTLESQVSKSKIEEKDEFVLSAKPINENSSQSSGHVMIHSQGTPKNIDNEVLQSRQSTVVPEAQQIKDMKALQGDTIHKYELGDAQQNPNVRDSFFDVSVFGRRGSIDRSILHRPGKNLINNPGEQSNRSDDKTQQAQDQPIATMQSVEFNQYLNRSSTVNLDHQNRKSLLNDKFAALQEEFQNLGTSDDGEDVIQQSPTTPAAVEAESVVQEADSVLEDAEQFEKEQEEEKKAPEDTEVRIEETKEEEQVKVTKMRIDSNEVNVSDEEEPLSTEEQERMDINKMMISSVRSWKDSKRVAEVEAEAMSKRSEADQVKRVKKRPTIDEDDVNLDIDDDNDNPTQSMRHVMISHQGPLLDRKKGKDLLQSHNVAGTFIKARGNRSSLIKRPSKEDNLQVDQNLTPKYGNETPRQRVKGKPSRAIPAPISASQSPTPAIKKKNTILGLLEARQSAIGLGGASNSTLSNILDKNANKGLRNSVNTMQHDSRFKKIADTMYEVNDKLELQYVNDNQYEENDEEANADSSVSSTIDDDSEQFPAAMACKPLQKMIQRLQSFQKSQMQRLGIRRQEIDKPLASLLHNSQIALLKSYEDILQTTEQESIRRSTEDRAFFNVASQSTPDLPTVQQLELELTRNPQKFFARLRMQQIKQLLCSMLPICKLRRSVFLFGTQSRRVLTDKKGELRIEVMIDIDKSKSVSSAMGSAMSQKSGFQAGYKSVPEYLNQNALKQCQKIYRSMSSKQMSFSQVVTYILRRLEAPQETIAWYENDQVMTDANVIFEILARLLNENLLQAKAASNKMSQHFGSIGKISKKKTNF